MSIDDRDYMKNRKSNDYYNPKEFRGSKKKFMQDPWLLKVTNKKQARQPSLGDDVTWNTLAFGYEIKVIVLFLAIIVFCLYLFKYGYIDNLINRFQKINSSGNAHNLMKNVHVPIATIRHESPSVSTKTYSIIRAADGKFYTNGMLNNIPVVFLIDTGASLTIISTKQAAQIGISTCYKKDVIVPLGISRDLCFAKIDKLEFGTFYMLNTEIGIASNLPADALLGMNSLSSLRVIQIGDKLQLESK